MKSVKFQYLLVRLKGDIPQLVQEIRKFQYLLVRLKDDSEIS